MGDDPRKSWRTFFTRQLREEVRSLAREYPERRSLPVDALDLYEFDPATAEHLFKAPDEALAAAEASLRDLHDGFDRVTVRPENYPGLLSVRSLRSSHRAELVAVEGLVSEAQPIRSKVATAVFECGRCGTRTARRPRGLEVRPPASCDVCDEAGSVDFLERASTFVDVRRVTLVEPADGTQRPGTKSESRAERWAVDVCLADGLVEAVASGDSAVVTGILRVDGDPPVNRFDFLIEALTVDTDVAVGPTPVPASASVESSTATDAGSDGLKAVLDSHWRSAVADDEDTERKRARASMAGRA